jgi:hypothetical protein
LSSVGVGAGRRRRLVEDLLPVADVDNPTGSIALRR